MLGGGVGLTTVRLSLKFHGGKLIPRALIENIEWSRGVVAPALLLAYHLDKPTCNELLLRANHQTPCNLVRYSQSPWH